jgi:hypothetical protein
MSVLWRQFDFFFSYFEEEDAQDFEGKCLSPWSIQEIALVKQIVELRISCFEYCGTFSLGDRPHWCKSHVAQSIDVISLARDQHDALNVAENEYECLLHFLLCHCTRMWRSELQKLWNIKDDSRSVVFVSPVWVHRTGLDKVNDFLSDKSSRNAWKPFEMFAELYWCDCEVPLPWLQELEYLSIIEILRHLDLLRN